MNKFALLGAAGYIAPRHFEAIKRTGNQLIAAMDPHDSVGILDSFFPDCRFFKEFERLDRYIERRRLEYGESLDFVSICTPNYLHDSHIRAALRWGAEAICEKPLVINPWNLDPLEKLEESTGKKINTILQLRLHPSLIKLRNELKSEKRHQLHLTYITSRGNWYFASWKGSEEHSGGICLNIGIHFFDMLLWLFGFVIKSKVHLRTHDTASGVLTMEKADVSWFLSIDSNHLPAQAQSMNLRTYRSILLNEEEIEFSQGFNDLHIQSYEAILKGEGFGLTAARPSIELTHSIRTASLSPLKNDYHPLAKNPINPHPFIQKP